MRRKMRRKINKDTHQKSSQKCENRSINVEFLQQKHRCQSKEYQKPHGVGGKCEQYAGADGGVFAVFFAHDGDGHAHDGANEHVDAHGGHHDGAQGDALGDEVGE